jgi:hypothetical protein
MSDAAILHWSVENASFIYPEFNSNNFSLEQIHATPASNEQKKHR